MKAKSGLWNALISKVKISLFAMPKISILVAVYNTAAYPTQCLDSLLSQTLKDIEVLCVDDASTDKSLDILHQYAEKDERVKVLR